MNIMQDILILIIGLLGCVAVVFFYVLGVIGFISPSITSFSSRRKIFLLYGSIVLVISFLSFVALSYSESSNRVGFSAFPPNFFSLIEYISLAGTGVAFFGLILGIIWPPLIFQKTREESFLRWGKIMLSLVALAMVCFAINSVTSWYIDSISPHYNYPYPKPTPLKPVIYLYPTHKESVSVELQYGGILTDTYPVYDPNINGWNVIAYPDGHLINRADNRTYSYLFWEGKDAHQYDLSTGFVVKGSDTASFLQIQLAKMGLTPKEYNEMIVYWLPKMQHNRYNLIHFAGTDYTNLANLTITPKPDSLLRIFMVWKPLQETESIQPQTFPIFERKGFTAVEWGGTELQ